MKVRALLARGKAPAAGGGGGGGGGGAPAAKAGGGKKRKAEAAGEGEGGGGGGAAKAGGGKKRKAEAAAAAVEEEKEGAKKKKAKAPPPDVAVLDFFKAWDAVWYATVTVGANKFYRLTLAGARVLSEYGSLDVDRAPGKPTVKEFDSADLARAFFDKRVGEQTAKGYVPVEE